MKLVKENILSPKDPKRIIKDLIEQGEIRDKYAIIVQLFNEDYNKIAEEFFDRGIDLEDLIDTYVRYYYPLSPISVSDEKLNWILSDILQDNIDKITSKIIKKSIT